MNRARKCCKCEKQIISGKFYNFFTGKKNGQRIVEYQLIGNNFFCPSCAEKEKTDPDNPYSANGNLLEIEWEIENSTDEEILKFEEKWWKYYVHNEFIKEDTDAKKILAWCQAAKQELEPYLQKLDIVAKSFGGKLQGYGKNHNYFYHLFDQSAKDKQYRKKVVEPTIAEILNGKFDQEINTTNVGSAPGVSGRTEGKLELEVGGNRYVVPYVWVDGPEGICRRICFEFDDTKLALQAFCRCLAIKEKELTGDYPNKLPPIDQNNSPIPSEKEKQSQPSGGNGLNGGIIALIVIGGIAVFGLVIFLLFVRKKGKII